MNWNTFHKINPYANFPHNDYELDLQGWNSNSPIFKELIDEIHPKLIIEVGSWKGASAIHMASLCDKDVKIICVDTWLGSLEMWRQDDGRYELLQHKFGYPQIYQQFLANVIKTKNQDVIIPLPMTSLMAAKLLSGVLADLIYVDGSHEYEDVYNDLKAYSPLGRVLFGDDFKGCWPGVMNAVNDFLRKFEVRSGFWVYKKENPP